MSKESCIPLKEKVLDKYLQVFGEGRQTILGFYLGTQFGVGLMLFFFSKKFYDLGLFLIALSVFHMWEYLYISIYRPSELSTSSFLLDHSPEFVLANIFAFLEYFVEKIFYPSMKTNKIIVYIGLVIVIIGQFIRTLSMIQCGTNFSLKIEMEKRKDHVLVTSGLYNYLRHPVRKFLF